MIMKQVLLFLPLALLLATAPMLPSVAGVKMIAQHQDRMGAQLEQLNLSESQKAQIASIRAAYRQELQAVLTPEQWQQWQQARQNGQRPDVNLSDDQEAKIKALRQKNRSQIEAVLTPEQRQQWAQIRPARQ
jgi:Spy/CpxP family protein refolding chaperone